MTDEQNTAPALDADAAVESSGETALAENERRERQDAPERSQVTADAETSEPDPDPEAALEQELPEVPPPPLPSHASLLLSNLVGLAVALWFGLDPLFQGLHQNDSLFRGTPYSSPWPFYAVGLAAVAVCGLLAIYRLIRRGADRADRTFRLVPIATIIFIAAHLMFIRSIQNPMLPPSALVPHMFASMAFNPLKSDDGLFPTTPKFYVDATTNTPPPYWHKGEKLTLWNVTVHERCAGPIDVLPSAVEPGTLLICLSEDRSTAWMSAVGLSRDIVGAPALIRFQDGGVLSVPLRLQKKAPAAGNAADGAPRLLP
ncbi:MAG: hypothetical protein LBM75_10675 [Myxococcales bacterium]|nr:hypothetical protein [Myxococcales bacterium]